MYTSTPPALAFACSLQPTQKTVISTEATDSLTVRRAAEKPASPPKRSQPAVSHLRLQFSQPKIHVKPQTNQKIQQPTHIKGFLSPTPLAHEFPPTS
jgi:hypothetical protein